MTGLKKVMLKLFEEIKGIPREAGITLTKKQVADVRKTIPDEFVDVFREKGYDNEDIAYIWTQHGEFLSQFKTPPGQPPGTFSDPDGLLDHLRRMDQTGTNLPEPEGLGALKTPAPSGKSPSRPSRYEGFSGVDKNTGRLSSMDELLPDLNDLVKPVGGAATAAALGYGGGAALLGLSGGGETPPGPRSGTKDKPLNIEGVENEWGVSDELADLYDMGSGKTLLNERAFHLGYEDEQGRPTLVPEHAVGPPPEVYQDKFGRPILVPAHVPKVYQDGLEGPVQSPEGLGTEGWPYTLETWGDLWNWIKRGRGEGGLKSLGKRPFFGKMDAERFGAALKWRPKGVRVDDLRPLAAQTTPGPEVMEGPVQSPPPDLGDEGVDVPKKLVEPLDIEFSLTPEERAGLVPQSFERYKLGPSRGVNEWGVPDELADLYYFGSGTTPNVLGLGPEYGYRSTGNYVPPEPPLGTATGPPLSALRALPIPEPFDATNVSGFQDTASLPWHRRLRGAIKDNPGVALSSLAALMAVAKGDNPAQRVARRVMDRQPSYEAVPFNNALTAFADGGVAGEPYIGGPVKNALVGEAGIEWVGPMRKSPVKGAALDALLHIDRPVAFANGGLAMNNPNNYYEGEGDWGKQSVWNKMKQPGYGAGVNPYANPGAMRGTKTTRHVDSFGREESAPTYSLAHSLSDMGIGGSGSSTSGIVASPPNAGWSNPTYSPAPPNIPPPPAAAADPNSGVSPSVGPNMQMFNEYSETLKEILAARGQFDPSSSHQMAWARGMAPLMQQQQQITFDQLMQMNRYNEAQRQFGAMHGLQADTLNLNAASQYNPYGLTDAVGDIGSMLTYYNRRR